MPLLDHFHPPVSRQFRWQSFHSGWIAQLVLELNQELLPEYYQAEENVKLGVFVETDVATKRLQDEPSEFGNGTATAVWAPATPTVACAVDLSAEDLFEVNIRDDAGAIVAVIELVSPGNKDRPSNRKAFVGKCVSLLREGISVIIVDLVTERHVRLHDELMQSMSVEETGILMHHLFAGAYRVVASNQAPRVEAWVESLSIGSPLPTLPLWLNEEVAVPLDLDKSYRANCAARRLSL